MFAGGKIARCSRGWREANEHPMIILRPGLRDREVEAGQGSAKELQVQEEKDQKCESARHRA